MSLYNGLESCHACCVIGPSHAIRWNWHVRDGVVKCDLPSENIQGLGGAPIWSKRMFDIASKHVSKGGTLLVMVGDFRFGNAIALAPEKNAGTLFQDGFLGIDATALTPEIDRKMLARGLAGVQSWVNSFGPKARFIFWDLFGRQVFDRLAGRHIAEGRYQHPVFNYAETVAQFAKADIVDLAPLLRQPIHEVRRLFIDQSCHPSQIGYVFLNEVLCKGRDVQTAYRNAVSEIETALLALARKVATVKGGPVLITGRSVWLETLAGYMGQSGMTRLAEAGLVLASLVPVAGQPTIAQMMQKVPLTQCTPVVLSAGGRDISAELARAFGSPLAFWRDVPVVDWEEGTKDVITARGETPRHVHAVRTAAPVAEVMTPTLVAHMVEQGPAGMPSWAGIIHLLEQIVSGGVPVRAFMASSPQLPTTKAVVGDVLLTDEGIAFLIGGNHSVLKYATGELKPSERSLGAFRSNIVARLGLAQSVRAAYAHVIFPDKQSVLSEAFPYQPVRRLGELYRSSMPAGLRSSVIYPADALRQTTEPSFLPLDTHLTDHGSLEVVRLVLEALGVDALSTLDHVKTQISRLQRWSGDLGNKFTPPLVQEAKVLDPDWSVTELSSPGGFNDGMVDILLNPGAAKDATLLLFGDSFFRMMLKHLSAVFSKVIHLRSRFVHPEMVSLIAPDYVLTGNAERYLSDVQPDSEAHAFFLYPLLRSSEAPMVPDAEFLAAWRAVTSPRSVFAATYFASKGFTTRSADAPITVSVSQDRVRPGA